MDYYRRIGMIMLTKYEMIRVSAMFRARVSASDGYVWCNLEYSLV